MRLRRKNRKIINEDVRNERRAGIKAWGSDDESPSTWNINLKHIV